MSQSHTTLRHFTQPRPADTAKRLVPSPLGEASPAHTPSPSARTI